MTLQPELHLLAEIALAMLLGGVIGVERELANKPAGFRTHMLVAGGAALLVGLADAFVHINEAARSDTNIQTDPIRIIEAIVTGISFLGAGTIFRHRSQNQVEGLTTAATILFAAAIGISVAVNKFVLAIGATLLCLTALRALYRVDQYLTKKAKNSEAA